VPNPSRDIFFVKARSLKNRACVTCCESGDFGGEKISKKAVLVIEAKVVAVSWLQMRCAFYDPDFPFCVGRLTGDDGCSGAIPKKAGANEDSGIIIEVRCGGANFHANDKGVAGLA